MEALTDLLLEPNGAAEKFLVMLIAVALFVAVMAVIVFVIDRPRNLPDWVAFAAFAGPAALLVMFGLVYPALRTVYQSFFDRTGDAFVGFDNFSTIFTGAEFRTVLVNTVVWVVLVPLMSTFIGLVYAVLVDRTRFEALAKALIFLPMAISLVGATIIWRFVYEYRPAGQEQIGLLNQLLVWVGLEPYQFIISQPWNNFFLVVIFVWVQAGFAMTVLSAAIKAVPDDIIEAARLDGVNGVQMFTNVTIPAIRPALVVVLTTIAIVSLKVFDIVRTMTNGNFGTGVVASEFYDQAFRQFNAGIGAALAVILFILVVPIVIYNIRQMRLAEEIR